MGQVTVVKGAYSGYCLWSIQTDFSNPEILVTHPRKSEISLEDPARTPLIVPKSSEAPLLLTQGHIKISSFFLWGF